jgi:hypothetical protein
MVSIVTQSNRHISLERIDHKTRKLTLVKGPETYIILYTDETRAEAKRTLGHHASNYELPSFTWADAADIAKKIGKEGNKQFMVRKRLKHICKERASNACNL